MSLISHFCYLVCAWALCITLSFGGMLWCSLASTKFDLKGSLAHHADNGKQALGRGWVAFCGGWGSNKRVFCSWFGWYYLSLWFSCCCGRLSMLSWVGVDCFHVPSVIVAPNDDGLLLLFSYWTIMVCWCGDLRNQSIADQVFCFYVVRKGEE